LPPSIDHRAASGRGDLSACQHIEARSYFDDSAALGCVIGAP